MISIVLLLSLYMAKTSIALQFHSPVHIIRPLDDVHTNCERDVQLICNDINMDGEYNLISDTTTDYSKSISDLEKKNDGTLLPRRLMDTGSDTVTKSRTYSIKVGLRATPSDSKDLDQRVKDNKRFLNYGPNIDTCLWNAYDAERVSSQCASALLRINKMDDYPTMKYSNESEYIKRTSISVSIPLLSLIVFIFGCMLVRDLCIGGEGDDIERDDQDNSDNDEVMDSEEYEYQLMKESKRISQIAAHLKPNLF